MKAGFLGSLDQVVVSTLRLLNILEQDWNNFRFARDSGVIPFSLLASSGPFWGLLRAA
jgi:hypothetical protein